MKFRVKYFFLILWVGEFFFTGNHACAQEEEAGLFVPSGYQNLSMGIFGGINFVNYHTNSFQFQNSSFKNGSGISPMIGILSELPLSQDYKKFVVFQVLYNSKSGKFLPDNGSSSLSASLTFLMISAGMKLNFLNWENYSSRYQNVPVGPGIQATLNIGKKLRSRFTEITSDYESSTEISGAKNISFSLCGQINWDIPLDLFGRMNLMPFVGYDFPLTKVDNTDRSWMVPSFYTGITFHHVVFIGYFD
jgi:hypothetical protein